jgi:hypothetical protein
MIKNFTIITYGSDKSIKVLKEYYIILRHAGQEKEGGPEGAQGPGIYFY